MLDGSIRKIRERGVCADAGEGEDSACVKRSKKKIYTVRKDRRPSQRRFTVACEIPAKPRYV